MLMIRAQNTWGFNNSEQALSIWDSEEGGLINP